jgi:hypothetical protein
MEFRFGETVYKFRLRLAVYHNLVGCYLENLGKADLALQYTFHLFNESGEKVAGSKVMEDIFLPKSWHGFEIKKETTSFLKVVCDFRVIDPVIEVRREGGDSRSLSTFADAGAELFKSGLLHDFTVKCDGQPYACHKAILAARCKYFEAMFNTDTLETAQGPANVIKLVFVIYG